MATKPWIGIRLEDKNKWERRVPLSPEHVKTLIDDKELRVTVQQSPIRAYSDDEYAAVGAELAEHIDICPVVFAVKEIPKELLSKKRTYVYFSHVIKGQLCNMPMLSRLMELGCSLIDYEKIVDNKGRRIIFFGFHAGLAGMIESLWSLGQRLAHEGIDTPLSEVRHAYEYHDLADAEKHLMTLGERLKSEGLPSSFKGPLVVGFAGYGNVSRGAQEVLSYLPVEKVTPEALAALGDSDYRRDRIYSVVFEEKHLAERTDGSAFVLQDYYDHPEKYQSVFEKHLNHLTALVNCIYWTERYPSLVTKAWARTAWSEGQTPNLRVVGDISCDIDGAIEFTAKSTDPGCPSFTWDPETDKIQDGVEGKGPVVMAVDNLPCELPRESSACFGDALLDFVPAIAQADYQVDFKDLALPPEIKRALIVYRGELMENYLYLREFLDAK